MQKRASMVSSGLAGLSQVANTVSTTAVSKDTVASKPVVTAFIRNLIISTNPKAYAAACLALGNAPIVDGKDFPCEVAFIAGEEDYLAAPGLVEQWASEIPDGKGSMVTLKDVGHWGAIEDPDEVGKALKQSLVPS